MNLKKTIVVAAILAVGGVMSAQAEFSQGPVKQGGMCWHPAPYQGPVGVSGYSGANGYGFYGACPKSMAVHVRKHRHHAKKK